MAGKALEWHARSGRAISPSFHTEKNKRLSLTTMKTKRLDLESQPTLPPHLTLTIVNEKEVGYNAEAQKIRLDGK